MDDILERSGCRVPKSWLWSLYASDHGVSLEGSISSGSLKSERLSLTVFPEWNLLLASASYCIATNSFWMSVIIYAIAVGSYNTHYVGLEDMRWTKDLVAQECCLLEEDDDNPGREFNLWVSYLLQINSGWFGIEAEYDIYHEECGGLSWWVLNDSCWRVILGLFTDSEWKELKLKPPKE